MFCGLDVILYIRQVIKREKVMKTFIGVVKKEEFVNDVFYFVDVPFEGSIIVDEDKFVDVEDYIDTRVEVETIVWDYRQKDMNRYKVIGIKK